MGSQGLNDCQIPWLHVVEVHADIAKGINPKLLLARRTSKKVDLLRDGWIRILYCWVVNI